MGKCCVTGCHSISVDYEARQFITQDGRAVKQGDIITLDGTTGEVRLGSFHSTRVSIDWSLAILLKLYSRIDRFIFHSMELNICIHMHRIHDKTKNRLSSATSHASPRVPTPILRPSSTGATSMPR